MPTRGCTKQSARAEIGSADCSGQAIGRVSLALAPSADSSTVRCGGWSEVVMSVERYGPLLTGCAPLGTQWPRVGERATKRGSVAYPLRLTAARPQVPRSPADGAAPSRSSRLRAKASSQRGLSLLAPRPPDGLPLRSMARYRALSSEASRVERAHWVHNAIQRERHGLTDDQHGART